MAEAKKMLTIEISEELHRSLKVVSVIEGRPMRDIVANAIRLELRTLRKQRDEEGRNAANG